MSMERLAKSRSIAAWVALGLGASALVVGACAPKEGHRKPPKVPTAANEEVRPCPGAANVRVITSEAQPSEADCTFLQRAWGVVDGLGPMDFALSKEWRIRKDRSEGIENPAIFQNKTSGEEQTYVVYAGRGQGSTEITAFVIEGLPSSEALIVQGVAPQIDGTGLYVADLGIAGKQPVARHISVAS